MNEHSKQVVDSVVRILIERTGIAAELVTLAANLTDDLGLDSLDVMDLLVAINEEFDIHLSPEILTDVQTVGQLIDAVVGGLQKQV